MSLAENKKAFFEYEVLRNTKKERLEFMKNTERKWKAWWWKKDQRKK
jgi:hypothetical protein